jgi:HKD family nuclease
MKIELLPSGSDLVKRLNDNVRAAEEVYLLMARVTASGYEQLKRSLIEAKRSGKRVTLILGVDMISASSPDAIRSLFRLQDALSFKLLCYNSPKFFHPKLFAFRKDSRWDFIIGSSNLTEEGLAENIEFNVLLSKIPASNTFVKSFESNFASILEDCKEFSFKQIATLEERAQKLASKYADWKQMARQTSERVKKRQLVEIAKWNQLVRKMKDFKRTDAYRNRMHEIPSFIRACKQTIGSASKPHVNAQRWNDRDIGSFSSLDNRNYKKTHVTSRKKRERLNKTLRFLFDQRIPIEERLRETALVNGKYHIQGMGITLLSEILSKYYPTEYFILGNPIVAALRHYGMRYIPSDKVEMYMAALSVYKRMREESKYPERNAFFLLDSFMWKKGHKILYGWS